MKDIDFDELDKAVNSLMATTKPAPTAAVEPVPATPAGDSQTPATVTVSPPSAPVVAVTPPEPATPAAPITTAIPVAVRPSAPAIKRSGRFMDMVNKPSDAKPRTASTAAPSREGISISPRPAEPTLQAAPTAAATVSMAAPEQKPASFETMPDPIDMQSQSFDAPSAPVSEPIDSTAVAPNNPPLGSTESPFLSDAKVEKRPLNSEPLEPTGEAAQFDMTDDTGPADTAIQPTEDEKGADEPPAVPQIAELSSDLVAIEADEKIDLTQAVDTADAAAQVTVPSVPLGASSIAQQYTTQPSSGDQSHAAIYDASQYPEPVSHPAKSKSGWLWVLWVVLLLGVGAGGAMLLYVLGIIP